MTPELLAQFKFANEDELKIIREDVNQGPEYKEFIIEKGTALIAAYDACTQRFSQFMGLAGSVQTGPTEFDRQSDEIYLGTQERLGIGRGSILATVEQKFHPATKVLPERSVYTTTFVFRSDYAQHKQTKITRERFGDQFALLATPPDEWTREDFKSTIRFHEPSIELASSTIDMLTAALQQRP